jgi:hypothetical protein
MAYLQSITIPLLAKLLKGQQTSIALNEVYEEDGEIVFREACKLGCEGDREQAPRLNISPWAVAALGEGQKSESTGSKTRSRRRLAQVESKRGPVAGAEKVLLHVAKIF